MRTGSLSFGNKERVVDNIQDHEIVESTKIDSGLLRKLFGATHFGAIEDKGEVALVKSSYGYNVRTLIGTQMFYLFPNYVNHSRAKVKYEELTK